MRKILLLSAFFLFFVLTALILSVPAEEIKKAITIQESAGLVLAEEKKAPEPVDIFKDTAISEIGGAALTAKAVLVSNVKTGKIIFSKSPEEIFPLASITKLMSLVIFLESKTDMEKIVTVEAGDSADLQKYVGVKDFISYVPLLAGDEIKVKDAVYSGMVHSANNAVKIFARATEISGEEFIQKMNEKARALNLSKTNFTEPTGLDAANVSTAYDVSLMADYAFKNPFICGITMTRKYSFSTLNTLKYKQVASTNQLLDMFNADYYQIIGGKTGYLGDVGYNVVAKARDSRGEEIIAVVIGAATDDLRFSEAKNLIIEGFKKIE
jgi:D-alanyl-D-alanine carboxypeptidase